MAATLLLWDLGLEKASLDWNITSLVAERKENGGNEQALQTLAQKQHLAVLLTFCWPKKVTAQA